VTTELSPKRVALPREAVPGVSRVGLLFNPANVTSPLTRTGRGWRHGPGARWHRAGVLRVRALGSRPGCLADIARTLPDTGSDWADRRTSASKRAYKTPASGTVAAALPSGSHHKEQARGTPGQGPV